MGGPGDMEKVKRKMIKSGRNIGGSARNKRAQEIKENFKGQQSYEKLSNVGRQRHRKRKTGEL